MFNHLGLGSGNLEHLSNDATGNEYVAYTEGTTIKLVITFTRYWFLTSSHYALDKSHGNAELLN